MVSRTCPVCESEVDMDECGNLCHMCGFDFAGKHRYAIIKFHQFTRMIFFCVVLSLRIFIYVMMAVRQYQIVDFRMKSDEIWIENMMAMCICFTWYYSGFRNNDEKRKYSTYMIDAIIQTIIVAIIILVWYRDVARYWTRIAFPTPVYIVLLIWVHFILACINVKFYYYTLYDKTFYRFDRIFDILRSEKEREYAQTGKYVRRQDVIVHFLTMILGYYVIRNIALELLQWTALAR